MNGLYMTWPGRCSEEFTDWVIARGEEAAPVQAVIGTDDTNRLDTDFRRSRISWLNIETQAHFGIRDTVMHYCKVANRNLFGFDIDYVQDMQYTVYESANEGKYDWHEDTFWLNNSPYHRKVSFILQLSDSDDYEGGDFEIDPQFGILPKDDIRKKGTIIVFPSFLKHRVTPVTSGTRRSLVSWVEGPCFK